MKFGKRVVLDTSTLISAMLLSKSIPRKVLFKALSEAELCASPATLAEIDDVISRDKFDRYLDLAARRDFVTMYRDRISLFQVSKDAESTLDIPCRDPRDNKFIALALTCNAGVLVSSDDDLLTLNPYGNVQILTPKAYLADF